jgi:hypothetical protein
VKCLSRADISDPYPRLLQEKNLLTLLPSSHMEEHKIKFSSGKNFLIWLHFGEGGAWSDWSNNSKFGVLGSGSRLVINRLLYNLSLSSTEIKLMYTIDFSRLCRTFACVCWVNAEIISRNTESARKSLQRMLIAHYAQSIVKMILAFAQSTWKLFPHRQWLRGMVLHTYHCIPWALTLSYFCVDSVCTKKISTLNQAKEN